MTGGITIVSRRRDRLDWIAQRTYGYASGAVEALLAANPSLAAQPVWLPAGVEIFLPRLPPAQTQRVRLWT